MERGKRIPLHNHDGPNSGGLVVASTIVTAMSSGGSTATVPAAAAIPIADLGALYAATDVESALAENAAADAAHLADTSAAHDASAVSIVDAGTYFTGTDVEAALQELGAAGGGVASLDAIPDVNAPAPANGHVLTWDSTPGEWIAQAAPGAGGGDTSGQFIVGFDGGGAAITAGAAVDVIAPYTGSITGWTMLADQSGSAVVDVLTDTYAGFPTFTSITASAKPTISTAIKATSSTLTGWTTAVTAGDILRFTLDSASTIERLVLVLAYSRP